MPDITVTNVPPINVYVVYYPLPEGVTANIFPFSFAITDESQIVVYLTQAGMPANDNTQVLLPNQYTVTINPAPAIGGTVALNTAALLGDRVTITRQTKPARTSNYADGNLLSASSLNSDCNTTVMIEQELNRYTTMLCPHYNQTESIDSSDCVLPRLSSGQVWSKGIMPGSKTAQNPTGTQGIIAESITNVLGGAPVALLNGPATINALPKFIDTAGNLTTTGITIDADNNITQVQTINAVNMIATGNVFANTGNIQGLEVTATNLSATNTTIETLTVNGLSTLTNARIIGTLEVSGVANIPGLTLGNINIPRNTIEALSITAPTITANNTLTARGSATVEGSLTVTAGGTTTILNQLVADNYSPANFRPVNINATGNINAGANSNVSCSMLIANSTLQICNAGNRTNINRAAGGDAHTLTLPNSLGDPGQVLALQTVANSVGTLIWNNAGGVLPSVNAVAPILNGYLTMFTPEANGNITSSGVAITGAANMSVGNVTTSNTGTIRSPNIAIQAPNGNTYCTLSKTNAGNTYGLALPPFGPTALNQPLVATSVGQNANCTLGWGSVYVAPPRAYGLVTWTDDGVITVTNPINIGIPPNAPGVLWSLNKNTMGANINNANEIYISFLKPFPNAGYMVKMTSLKKTGYTFVIQICEQLVGSCRICFLFTHSSLLINDPTHWNYLKSFYIEITG